MADNPSSGWTLASQYIHRSRHSWWSFPFFNLGLQLESQYDKWKPWVVKLEFALDGEPGQPTAGSNSEAKPNDIPRIGSGFYLNIDGATYCGKPVDVILTAGHNLVQPNGTPSRNLRVCSRADDPVGVEVCRGYDGKPGQSEKDWGAIFFPRDAHKANAEPSGFDFNLLYGEEGDEGQDLVRELSKSGMTLAGYTDGTELGEPRTSALQDVHPTRLHLRYKSATNQGISGAPIWGICEKRFTVVGIHTGKRSHTGEGRGVRLSTKVLQQIFSWAGVGYYSKVLRAHNRPAFADGLYLRFPEYADFGLVHLGKDGLNTSFDILPALFRKDGLRFAFCFVHPSEGTESDAKHLWVRWETNRNRVTLSPTLHPSCLVTIDRKENPKVYINYDYTSAGPFNLATGKDNMILCLGATNIRPREDRCYGRIESAGVCFERTIAKEGRQLLVFE